ncbi:PAS-domain containing protein [Pelagibius sp. CAU 1746]|uniref:sensor histidine kinase n=1 Tax=Pelagibius sp. CAU 1746 TaxID=3140370 RepID=UPI00325B4D71
MNLKDTSRRRLLSRWPAAFIAAVLIGTTALVLYVEASISELKQVLPVEVLRQERDVVFMIDDLAALQQAIREARAHPGIEGRQEIIDRIELVESRVAELTQTYSFSNQIGIASMHATLRPVAADLKLWLSDGVQGLSPDSEVVLDLAAERVVTARQEIVKQFGEANAKALAMLQEEATDLERFRGALILVVIVVAALTSVLVAFIFRERRSELAAAAAQQRLRESIESLAGGFALFDVNEKLVLCNRRYGDLYAGVRDMLVPGMSFEELITAAARSGNIPEASENAELWVHKQLQHFRNPGRPFEVELRDGTWFRVAERRTANGGFVVISTNITELRRRESELRSIGEELRHKNVLLDAALDNMAQGLAMFDVNQRMIICNQRFLDLYNLPANMAQPGTELSDILSYTADMEDLTPEQAKILRQRRLATAASPEETTMQDFLSNGRVINVVHRPMPGGGSLATYDDVTGSYSAERQLRIAKEEAELASRAKSDFLANVSHELRTPLNAIIGFSEIIKDQLFGPMGNQRYREYAIDIHDSGTHLLSLINDILDLSKIEAGKFELHEEAINLERATKSCFRIMRDRAEEAGVVLEHRFPAQVPNLRADPRAVKQILLNLLSNAVKFTDPGGRVLVYSSINQEGGLVLHVEDTGIGIAEADIAKAMAPFGQVDSSLSRKYEGTGLGLPLTRHLVDLHDGNLTLSSNMGQGTHVSICFPHHRVISAPLPFQPRRIAGKSA